MNDGMASVVLQELWPYILVMSRLTGAIITLPGFSEPYVSGRIRLFLSLGLTIAITPLVSESLVNATIGSYHAILLIASEFLIGAFLGLIAKCIVSSLDVAGSVIGFQISLANAFVFNPSQAQQTNIVGALLTTSAILLIFAMDLHYLMINGIIDSYSIITVGGLMPFEQMAETMTSVVGKSFLLGAKLSAPFIILGTTIIMALGLLNRLMPQVQIYFISQPFILGVGFLVLALVFGPIMRHFIDSAKNNLALLGG